MNRGLGFPNGTSLHETAAIFNIAAALERLPDDHQLLMHSDQGWHYQMKQYRHTLQSKGIVQSMSRKGNCYDNSVMENFFGIMKSEFLYLKEFKSIEHFKE